MEIFETVAKFRSTSPRDMTANVFLAGYHTVGDRGGGLYTRARETMVGPGVITSADGACWTLADPYPNVLQYGAVGDGITDNTAALQGALDLVIAGGRLMFPSGTYNYTALNVDNAAGLVLEAEGPVTLNCTGDGSSGGLSARSTDGLTLCGIELAHASPTFTGYLLDLSHVDGAQARDSRGFRAEKCGFNSNSLYSASGVNLDRANGALFHGCRFQALTTAANGQTGASRSLDVTFRECIFADNAGYAVNNPGIGWNLEYCLFQASDESPSLLVYHGGLANPWRDLVFYRCNMSSQTRASPKPAIDLGPGEDLMIFRGVYAGGNDAFLSSRGVVSNLRVVDNAFTDFAAVFTPVAPGQQGWSIGPSNAFTNCEVVVANTQNVVGLDAGSTEPADLTR